MAYRSSFGESGSETLRFTCSTACSTWRGFLGFARCSDVPALDLYDRPAITRLASYYDLVCSAVPYDYGSNEEPLSEVDFFRRLPPAILSCTVADLAGEYSIFLHEPIDGVVFVSFLDSPDDWCFRPLEQFSSAPRAVNWLSDRLPESVLLALAVAQRGPLLDGDSFAANSWARERGVVSYDFSPSFGFASRSTISDLAYEEVGAVQRQRVGFARATTSLTFEELLKCSSPKAQDLLSSVRDGGNARDRWRNLLIWGALEGLPGGPTTNGLELQDWGLSDAQTSTLLAMRRDWHDSAQALVAAAKALT